MEPITLCGLAIVLFGLWIECEVIAKALTLSVRRSKILKGIIASATSKQKPANVNRYAPYPPRYTVTLCNHPQ